MTSTTLDINLIKKYLESDIPADREKAASYYSQLKNLKSLIPPTQLDNGTTTTTTTTTATGTDTNTNNQQILESIDLKMKMIENQFAGLSTTQQQSQTQHNQAVIDNYHYTTFVGDNQQPQSQQIGDNQQQQPIQPSSIPILNTLLEQQKRRHHHHGAGGASASSTATTSSSSSSHHRNLGPPEIPPEEIVFDPKVDHLGGGAYGKVYKATCRGKKVAVKVPKKQILSESELKAFKNEVEIMKQIFHPNVVLFLGACTKPGKIMIVSELMQSDLEKLIHSPEGDPPTLYQRMKMASDAAFGMNWLHGICNILHRDLKLANLMIGKDNTVKITDFGFSQVIKSGTSVSDQRGPKGTALYMAPEVMMKQSFNEKADVYSFGLILNELATCEELFPEYSEIEPFSDAICNKRIRPPIPSNIPRSLAVLMSRCWDHDPNVRPPFSEVVEKMNDVLIDIALTDQVAAKFWKTNFKTPEEVKWTDFALKLAQALQIDIQELRLLSKLFVSNDEEENGFVKMERFDLMHKWFGPFFNIETGSTIIHEMNELLRRKWFHFDISRDVAERRLRGRPENTFLIRLSLNDPVRTPLTISKIKSSKPTHKRVSRVEVPISHSFPMGFEYLVPIDGQELSFNSIVSLVDRLKGINNLGADCPHSSINIPYTND